MNKFLSRLILWFTALSAVFFTSSAFASTASDWSVYSIGSTNSSRVYDASWSVVYCALAWWSDWPSNSWSLCTSNVNAQYDYLWWPVRKYDSYYTQRYSVNFNSNVIPANQADIFTINCKNGSGAWRLQGQTIQTVALWVLPTVNMYGNYTKVNYKNKWDNLFYDRFYRASDCAIITEAVALALPAYIPPWTCNSDTIATWWNCSCKNTGTYSATASWSVPMVWRANGVDVSGSITNATTYDPFTSKFNSYYIKLPSGSSLKPNLVLGTIDASSIGGARSVQTIWASTWMIYSDSRTLVSTASWNYYLFYTGDATWSSNSLLSSANPLFTNSASNDDNTFNSFVINSSSGSFLAITANRFSIYYQATSWLSLSNVTDNYTYLGDYLANSMITLPYGQKTRRIKIVPLSSTVYVSGVSPYNTSFVQDQVCSVLDGSPLTAEIASRSSLSWSIIANTNFCGSALDVPYIGSALGAMCNFVQPLIKPLVSGYQTTVDMINIIPPSTAPTTFDYYPSFTFSWMTMHISTQTGAIPVYSTWSDVNPLQITSDEASSNMKIWVLALISIILYLVVYALHFWIVAGLVWLLLHISRFFTGFLWKHSGTGNIWTLAPFVVYAWVFFTALISLVASVSFIFPLLQVIRAYALFLITWLTSFAPWSYALFSGFYIVVFSSIFLVGTFYLIYVLFEKHSRLN